ncbi:hypothetical protein PC39_02747 [Salinisphaera sp. PC39]|uniref:YqgE/AlgH family protein n=1 Tax=Salinisphaera sp. PC39 TaxID=1304156 RepID=UPI00334135A8
MTLPRVPVTALACLLALAAATPALAADSSLRGTLLVAERQLSGTAFARAVILVLEHDDGGALGLVLNRPSDATLADALPNRADELAYDYPVHLGGPVRMQGLALLARTEGNEHGSRRILPEVVYTHAQAAFDAILASSPDPDAVRIFAGHAGWAPGQLENEIRRGDWLIVPAKANHIFEDNDDDLWQRLQEQAAGSAKGGPLHSI